MKRSRPAPQRPCFVGLDCETTGPNPEGYRLIQIGLCFDDGTLFSSRVGWHTFEYEQEALDAIGVKVVDIPSGPPAEQVDGELTDWLRKRSAEEGSLVPVGWGVSNFDMPFVKATLPIVFETFLTHRSVELNAVCYTVAGAKTYRDRQRPFDEWKAMAKEAAEDIALRKHLKPVARHDAGYDAMTSILAWRWLQRIVEDPWPATSHLELSQFRNQTFELGQCISAAAERP